MHSPKNHLISELQSILDPGAVLSGDAPEARPYLHDATEAQATSGRADAIAFPDYAAHAAAVVAWCYEHDVPVVPRGGGTGFAGAAVPLDGGIVLSLERLAGPAQIDPEHWRAYVQAGTTTADVRRRARETGLYYPPDPGAGELSAIGGNIATNAGGPHTFKYGVTGVWVTGLDVILAPGELITVGGTARKDVGGYDLRSLLVGSEGTLGVVTGAWLKLIPAPEAALPVVGFYADARSGTDAIGTVMSCGVQPSAIEFLDRGALQASIGALMSSVSGLPADIAPQTGFMLIAESDGSSEEVAASQGLIAEAMGERALAVYAPAARQDIEHLWRWRSAVSTAVIAQLGGKLSEDIVVGVEHLAEVVDETLVIGARHDLGACSWGHAGDGNVHATFMIDAADPEQVRRATDAGHELFELAARLGGAVSGEHGLGLVKNGALELQWPDRALDLHGQIKRVFDPKGLLNPGKKLARLSHTTETTAAQLGSASEP